MAHFYVNAHGNRGERTACGTKNSGAYAHVRGWNVGAEVYIEHRDGKDIVSVWKTTGSNGHGGKTLLAEFESQV